MWGIIGTWEMVYDGTVKGSAILDVEQQDLSPYIGHDTVSALGLDNSGHMATCTSTSGLFFKSSNRVGDSPIPGAGFYVRREH